MNKFRIAILLLLLLNSVIVLCDYQNPVQGARDSPDPGVIVDNNLYYAVTTMGWDGHYFPIWKSTDATNFTQIGWAMPSPPAWTKCCDFWAPEIHKINGYYNIYYTARAQNGMLSIGVAQAQSITGPYVDKGAPIVTNASEGVIDATIYQDGSRYYLIYKVDGNAHGQPTLLYAVALSSTGLDTQGSPQLLLRDSQAWERGIVQGQWFIKQGNYYYLFYSGCGYNNDCYSVGVARSLNFLGPYEKYTSNPILHTRGTMTEKSWEGPGHCSVVKKVGGTKWLMIYHAWPRHGLNTKRVMLMDEVTFSNGWPKVGNGYPSEDVIPTP